ncbi:zinc finger protein [Anabrus simplex]|uniref:zinc finger protein n=1 Tax=Anabrus simplex TaxID=316456 RepID=UPI0035A364AB
MTDNITAFLNNDVSCVKTEESAVYSHHRDEGRPHALSRYNLSDKREEFSSSTREDVTMECENLDVFLPSYVEKFVCNKCAKSFVTHKMLTDHQKVHSGEWSYDSDICQAPLTRNSVQQRRQKVHVGGQLVFSCDKCNRLFDSYLGSQIHKGHCGKVSKSCYCDELGIPCLFKNRNRNQQRHVQKAKLPFCCCICGKCFRLRKSLTNHVVTHSLERPYNCAECGQGYKCRMGLIRHMAVHTNIKSYTCGRCSRDFLRKHDLKLHMLTHSEERPYTCNECGRGFKSRQVLIDHCATHNVIKSFFCKSCSRGFRSRRAVYDHMCAHSKVKKFTCKECSRGYKCRKAFKRHVNNHAIGK